MLVLLFTCSANLTPNFLIKLSATYSISKVTKKIWRGMQFKQTVTMRRDFNAQTNKSSATA